MNTQGGEQTHDGARDASADGGEGVVLGRFGIGEAVETARDAFDGSVVHQAPQLPGANSPLSRIAGAKEGPATGIFR